MPLILNGTTGVSGIDGSAGTPSYVGGDSDTGLWYPAANTLALSTSGSERLRIDSSGRLLVGATSASVGGRVEIVSQSNGDAITIRGRSSDAYGTITFNANSAVTEYARISGIDSSSLIFGTGSSGTERMRITSGGSVGIGTTSPSATLHVKGGNTNNLMVDNGGQQYTELDFLNNGTIKSYFYWDNTNANFLMQTAAASSSISFGTVGTERMRITSAGYLKVSNDGTYTNVSDSFHEVNQSANNHAWYIRANNASQTLDACQISTARNTTNNSYYALAYYNGGAGAYKFRVADSGNCTNTNGSYGTISDIKNKENIVDATPKLDKVKQLKVRNYNFKGDDLKQIGFVAQEFEQVFPSMVEEHSDRDAEGNDLGTTTKSIKTSVLVPILVKAIQEQQAMIEELKAKVAALEK